MIHYDNVVGGLEAMVKPRSTMWDVARAAGVSLKTVSRVVNNETGVGTTTAARVKRAIDALGYRPNDMARNLRRQRSSSIGLIIEDIRNPFYSAIARAVEEVAQGRKHLVIVGNSNEDPVAERRLVGTFLERSVGGLLLVPAGSDHAYLDGELGFGLPVVFIDRPAGNIEADTILIDDAGGARMAAEHLVGQGHRRIGVVGDPRAIYTIGERVAGFRKALAEAGVPLDESLLRLGARDVLEAETATRELLTVKDPPTAIFAANNRASVGALRAMRSAESRVTLVGFDDFELADLLSVTVVRHNPLEMGRRAAELLFSRLAGDDRPPQTLVLPTELVVRGSAGPNFRNDGTRRESA
jgi:LacI family transcriptional regulator